MKADKGQFDELLRRMLNKKPKKTSEIKRKGLPRMRKNPETDPAYLPVFDFSKTITVTPEEYEEMQPPKLVTPQKRKKTKK